MNNQKLHFYSPKCYNLPFLLEDLQPLTINKIPINIKRIPTTSKIQKPIRKFSKKYNNMFEVKILFAALIATRKKH